VVDLLKQRHEGGRRFEPTEFIEDGHRVAVRLEITDVRWQGESVETYKVFTFREPGGAAVLLQDCIDREDALAHLSAS
jgi:hypothetical protein